MQKNSKIYIAGHTGMVGLHAGENLNLGIHQFNWYEFKRFGLKKSKRRV